MRSKIAIVIFGIALAWGLEQVVVSPLETGSVYPQYSSLRSDPMGSLALYESLGKILKVERLYKSRLARDPGPGTTILVLGVDPSGWSKLEESTFKEYEDLISKGARLIIAFLPISNIPDDKSLDRWHVHFAGKHMRTGPEWKKLDDAGIALERSFGAGSVVLLTESYPLSNQGLREMKEAGLIVKLVGPAKEIVFDENHFGVVETGSVTKLMRKYHLEGALAVLAIVAALFLWRSASSLLPSRAPRVEQAVTGRDSLEGMTALLRRGIAEKDLVRVCYEEWRKTSLHDDKVSKNSVYDAFLDQKNAVSAYKALMEKL